MKKSEFPYKIIVWMALFVVISFFSKAQEVDNDIQQLIEMILQENEQEDFDYDTFFEQFLTLQQQPINLNKADLVELEESNLFSSAQISALLKHIQMNGKLLNQYELQAVPKFDVSFIKSILPFIKIDGNIEDVNIKFSKLVSKGLHQVFLRYQQKFPKASGYIKDKYLGNPSKVYLRYKYGYGNTLSYGITAEKDAGEPMFRQKNKVGFDFYSLHFFWRKNSKWRAIAVGDYQVNLGQGLVMWSGFGFNKTTNTAMVKKQSSILKPFTSVNEYLYLRGAAFTYQHKDFLFTPFVSFKNIDANINYTDTATNEIDNNRIQVNGFHRTETEMHAKNALQELKTGFNVQYKKRDKHFGLNYLTSFYTKPITFERKLYNKYQFQGKLLQNISVDYHYLFKSFHFFGEEALSISTQGVGYALLNGMLFNPSQQVDVSVVHRYYAPQYQTMNYTKAFAESTTPNNEHGVYFGIQAKPFKRIQIAAYYDYYTFPWLKFRADKPSKGQDILAQIKYKPSKRFELYANYKWETKEENTKIDLDRNDEILVTEQNENYFINYFGGNQFQTNDLNQLYLSENNAISKADLQSATFVTPNTIQRLRIHSSFSASKHWQLDTRVEFSFYKDKINAATNGYLVYQNVKYSNFMFPLSFSARIALFDIPKYDARIYAYENDVLYQFTIPAFFNTGLRSYLNMQYKISRNIQFWLRLAHTYYSDINEIGSGNESRATQNVFELKTQVRFKF